MAKELHYFNLNGLAEPIRYILCYTKQEFKDVRYDYADWPIQELKDSLPYGRFPLYKEGDRSLHQSLVICKHVARDTVLTPEDPWEQAVVESMVHTICDYWSNVSGAMLETDLTRKEQMKKKLLEEIIDFYFSRFEKTLMENCGFFIGKLSWAEFALCGYVESTNLFMGIEVEKKYPMVAAAVEIVRNLPGVKEHIEKRGPYVVPPKLKL